MTSPLFLIVDDDEDFGAALSPALTRRGFTVFHALDIPEALEIASNHSLDYATIDLRLAQGATGLSLIPALKSLCPAIKVVVLTGYASIATAVDAIKLGAEHYLAKPVHTDLILQALTDTPLPASSPIQPSTLQQHSWEHIQQVLQETNFNISESARRLGLHRRTLQRKLQKKPTGL